MKDRLQPQMLERGTEQTLPSSLTITKFKEQERFKKLSTAAARSARTGAERLLVSANVWGRERFSATILVVSGDGNELSQGE